MLNFENLVALAKATAKADKNAPVAYSYEDKNYSYAQVNETLRQELNELVGTPAKFRENKNIFFSLIEEVIGEAIPRKVAAFYEGIAETKVFGQGEKPEFKRMNTNARTRAKQFVTKVGLAGRYETFKLGGAKVFEVPTSAIGGAAQIGVEEFLDGRVDFAELIAIVEEGMEDRIKEETGKALTAGVKQLPTANVVEWTGFDEQEFDRLLTIADSYGSGKATIYCDFMFAAKILPAEAKMSDGMKDTLWRDGYFAIYKNHNVVILDNAVADNTNTELLLDPSYCFIIPSSSDAPIRIAIEGATLTKESDNDDWSKDIQVYKKVGVAAMFTSDICVYHDKALSKALTPKVQG